MFCLHLSKMITEITGFLNFVDAPLSKEMNPIRLGNAIVIPSALELMHRGCD